MKYLIETAVLRAEGSQTWVVEADSPEEALERFDSGDGDIVESNVDVTAIGDPVIVGEDMPDESCVSLADLELRYLQFFYENADFGPAHDDVLAYLNEQFTAETGLPIPHAYQPN